MAEVRFTAADLDLFSAASHDVNPLHLSDSYSRVTAYGQRVVFGILGVLAAFRHFPQRPGQAAKKIAVQFPSPMYLDVSYRVEIENRSADATRARIYDGRRLVCSVDCSFHPVGRMETAEAAGERGGGSARHRTEAAEWTDEQLRGKPVCTGTYLSPEAPLQRLDEQYGLSDAGIPPMQAMALLWSSYFVGMEAPGRRALYSKATLEFAPNATATLRPLDYSASLKSFDERFSLLAMDVSLGSGASAIASGSLQSFVHQDLSSSRNALPAVSGNRFSGRRALIIGASRGLGAVMTQGLVSEGAQVYATYSKSAQHAKQVEKAMSGSSGTLEMVQGDAADRAWCEAFQSRLTAEGQQLDLLVCNASPSLLPLWLEPASADRINDYIHRSVSLVSTPLASFLPFASAEATIVIVSSIAVVETVAEWPHYIAAKCAIEGLAKVAAAEYPKARFVIMRPPRLLTDLTNTPLGRQNTLSPASVTVSLLEFLASGGQTSGRVQILDRFEA